MTGKEFYRTLEAQASAIDAIIRRDDKNRILDMTTDRFDEVSFLIKKSRLFINVGRSSFSLPLRSIASVEICRSYVFIMDNNTYVAACIGRLKTEVSQIAI